MKVIVVSYHGGLDGLKPAGREGQEKRQEPQVRTQQRTRNAQAKILTLDMR